MSANAVGFALLILGLALLIGKIIRVKVGIVQSLFLPSSIVGGALLLLLGPEVLGRVTGSPPQLCVVLRIALCM